MVVFFLSYLNLYNLIRNFISIFCFIFNFPTFFYFIIVYWNEIVVRLNIGDGLLDGWNFVNDCSYLSRLISPKELIALEINFKLIQLHKH